MKLLPKKSIDIAKANERKIEIDAGVSLARKIDSLRETKDKEEQQLREWRENSIKAVQKEINDYIIAKDTLKKEVEDAEIHRKKLLEPLDKEWEEVNKEKSLISEEKANISKSKESLRQQIQKIRDELEKVSKVVLKSKEKEIKIDKLYEETVGFKEMAEKEYKVARIERIEQTNKHEKEVEKARQTQKEYEVALSTVEIRDKALSEKEKELIIREQTLQRRIQNFERVTKL